MQSANIKETAHQLIDSLPDDTSWEKLVYTLQVRHDIEAGLKDSEEGHVMDSGELRRSIGMDSDATTTSRMDPASNAPPSADT